MSIVQPKNSWTRFSQMDSFANKCAIGVLQQTEGNAATGDTSITLLCGKNTETIMRL